MSNLNKVKHALLAAINDGSNPSGGSINIATLNYQTTLLQQWIALSLGSSAAQLMNLVNSELETFNLMPSTFFYAGQSLFPNAGNDNIYALQAASGARLAGVINPVHLRLSARLQGTGNASGALLATDIPFYNANYSPKVNLNNYTALTPLSQLLNGVPSAISYLLGYPVTQAFDGSTSSAWLSNAVGVLPTPLGTPSANFGNGSAASAFDGSASSAWDSGAVTNQNVFSSLANTGFGNNNTSPSTLDLGAGNSFRIGIYKFTFRCGYYGYIGGQDNTAVTYTVTMFGSNDNATWTQLDSWTGVPNQNGCTSGSGNPFTITRTVNAATAYRYFKWSVSPLSSAIYNQGGNSYDSFTGMLFYSTLALTPANLNYDLGAGNEFAATQYSFNATASNKPVSWILQGSSDNATWTNLDSQSNYAGAFPFSNTFVNSTPYRYYRLYLTQSNATLLNQVAVAELRIATSSSPFISPSTPAWLSYDVGANGSKLIQQYTVKSSTYVPANWQFQGSNDNSTWTTLDTVTGNTSTNVTRTFANTTLYRYYRLLITASNNGTATGGNSDFVQITELTASGTPVIPFYDTTNYTFGTSSIKLRFYGLTGIAQNANELQLGNLNWRFSVFVNFDDGFNNANTNQAIFTILGKQLEIVKTPTGLNVNYSTNGTTFTTVSANYAWASNTWYWIAVGVNNGTLYLTVNGVTIGTASMAGVSLYNTTVYNPGFYIGMDSTQANPLLGNIQEAELFVGECPAFVAPSAARTTAYIPGISWLSKSNYIPSDATALHALFFQDESTFASMGAGVPLAGTDWLLYVSLDNGATFHEIPMVKTSGMTTLTNIYSGTLDLTGLPNTNQLIYKIVSSSGKVLKWDGLVLFWE